jgi:hypothetical protein
LSAKTRAIPWFTVLPAVVIGASGTLFMMFYWSMMAQSGWSPPVLETAGVTFGLALITSLVFPRIRASIFGLIVGSVGSIVVLIGWLFVSTSVSGLWHEFNTVKIDDLQPDILEQSLGLKLPANLRNLHSQIRRNEQTTIYVRFEIPQSEEPVFFATNKLKVVQDETHFWVHGNPNKDWWNPKRSERVRYVFLKDYEGTWGVPTTKTGFEPSILISDQQNGAEMLYLIARKF